MRQVKLLGLVFAAVFALAGMALSSSASAIIILPTSVKERKFTGKNDEAEPHLVALKNTIACKEATAEGTEESEGKPLGLFHIHFLGCKGEEGGIKFQCNSLGDVKEVILMLGTWHLVYDVLEPGKLVATLFLLNHLHLECGVAPFITLIDILGELLCLDLEAGSKKKSHLFHCHQSEALQLETVWWDDKGEGKEMKGAELKCKKDAGVYLHCAWLMLGLVEHEVELVTDF